MNTTREKYESDLKNQVIADFKNHQITSEILTTKLGRWTLSDPNSPFNWVEIVELAHGTILVHGDADPVLFGLYSGPDYQGSLVEWVGKRESPHDPYLAQKGSIGTQVEMLDYDPKVALADAEEWISMQEAFSVDFEAWDEALDHIASEALQPVEAMLEIIEDTYDTCKSWGKVTSYRLGRAWAALNKLNSLLDTRRKDAEDKAVLRSNCPKCGKLLISGDFSSGVKCPDKKCGYWFCY